MTDKPIDPALAAQGATTASSDLGSVTTTGPAPPAAASNEPPVVVAAVVVPAVEAPAAEDPKPTDAPLDLSIWTSTGDPVGDSVLALMQNAGMKPEEAKALMYDAVIAGDVTKVNRAALVAKVGENQANLILAGATSFVATSAAKVTAILTEVHTVVGGKDNWTAVAAWAQNGIEEGALTEYRGMIDAGGAQARFAAAELSAKYNADPANTSLTAAIQDIVPSARVVAAGTQTTRAEYVAALTKLHARGNPTEAQIAEVQQARNRGRAAGI